MNPPKNKIKYKMRENQEKYDENLKILCKAEEKLENLSKEQNQQIKGLLAEKYQHTQAILNTQSTNNELKPQVTSLKRVNLELEKTIHFLEKSKIKRKPESYRNTRENTTQMLDLNVNNLSDTKQLEPVPQNKEKLCHACGSEKHEIKDCKSKKNICIKDLKRNINQHIKYILQPININQHIIAHKLRKELEKYWEVKSMRIRQDKHG